MNNLRKMEISFAQQAPLQHMVTPSLSVYTSLLLTESSAAVKAPALEKK